MKKIVVLLFAVLGVLGAAQIAWQKDLTTALHKAQAENKLVMVMVEGEYCRWCKKMRYRTLSDDTVAQKLSSYVSVRVDENDKRSMAILPAIRGVPTIFFLYPDGKVLQKVEGYYDIEDFLSFFKEIDRKVWRLKKPTEGKV